MLKTVKFNSKEYMIDTTPEGQFARAEVTEMARSDAGGAFANAWEYATGQRLQDVKHYMVEDEDLIALTLHLGHKFSRSKAWRRLYDWAYWERRRQDG